MSKYNRKFGPSPLFSAQNSSAIAASSIWYYDFSEQESASQKYLPFDSVIVTNNSSHTIKFYPNQDKRFKLVAAGSIAVFDKNSIPALRTFKIENVGSGEISANQLEVAVQRETIGGETAFQKAHKFFFDGSDVM